MRKLAITFGAAAAAVGLAAPASAQWYPQQQPHGYQQPYGYQHQNFGYARGLQARVDRIQRDLRHLAQYRMISRSEYNNRNQDARDIERRLRRDYRDGRGLNQREVYQVQRRIARLEQRIARDVRDGRRYAFRWN